MSELNSSSYNEKLIDNYVFVFFDLNLIRKEKQYLHILSLN